MGKVRNQRYFAVCAICLREDTNCQAWGADCFSRPCRSSGFRSSQEPFVRTLVLRQAREKVLLLISTRLGARAGLPSLTPSTCACLVQIQEGKRLLLHQDHGQMHLSAGSQGKISLEGGSVKVRALHQRQY